MQSATERRQQILEFISDNRKVSMQRIMKMLVDRIRINNKGIVVEFKCGVEIEQQYVR